MKHHIILNIVLPALALAVLAIGLAFAARAMAQLAENPSEEQLEKFSRRIENNELSVDTLKDISVEAARSRKEMNRRTSDLMYSWSLGVAFFGAWLTAGCYRQIKKAQQGAPGDRPRPTGSVGA